MVFLYFATIFGGVFFLFRLWLSMFKLKDELQFRRFYVSRLVNYYFCLMLIFNFQSIVFNVIVATCLPAMLFTTIWDVKFYQNFKKRNYWKKNRGWLFVERLTMHPPILITGLYMYITGISTYIPNDQIVPFIIGIVITFGSSFIFDIRLRKKYNWPNGRDLLLVMIFSTLGFSFYYILSWGFGL
ncbi:MAG: hypothetical protein JW776_04615 [Candidatus Lokiarchaeota archaeon]|nr:hypothetical protein [Candidatus Lokiarchaeota archaeon]